MKAKKIAIFDSAANDLAVTAEAVREYFERKGVDAEVKAFGEHVPLIYDFRDNHYDMAFIGIASVLDMEAARSVRMLDGACPMFLVSSVGDFAMEGYRLNALDYLVKPVTRERVGEAVDRINEKKSRPF